MRKSKLVFLQLVFLALGFCAFAKADELLVASNYSDRYHRADCRLVEKIPQEERVSFQSEKEAEDAGYIPCKKCHPLAVSSNFNSNRKSL